MLPFKVDLTYKTVVITSGADVIGSKWSKSLAKCGANVAIINHWYESRKGEAVAKRIEGMGGKAIFIVANVIDKKAVEKAKTIVHNTFGKIDILINGAGENHP